MKELETTENKQRSQAHLWKPGQSGNPGGRPKGHGKIKEMARQNTEKAILTLVEALEATKVVGLAAIEVPDHQVRISAANALLDRGWGKPAASDKNEDEAEDLSHLSNDELKKLVLES
jgi:hypothetical protein